MTLIPPRCTAPSLLPERPTPAGAAYRRPTYGRHPFLLHGQIAPVCRSTRDQAWGACDEARAGASAGAGHAQKLASRAGLAWDACQLGYCAPIIPWGDVWSPSRNCKNRPVRHLARTGRPQLVRRVVRYGKLRYNGHSVACAPVERDIHRRQLSSSVVARSGRLVPDTRNRGAT